MKIAKAMIALNIKCIFPYNYYLLREVTILVNGEKVSTVGHLGLAHVMVNVGDEVSFKLDFYRSSVRITEQQQEQYLLLYFHFRDYFPFYYIDFFSRSTLRAKFLLAEEFSNVMNTTYSPKAIQRKATIDAVSIVLLVCMSLLSLAISVFFPKQEGWMQEFAFIVGAVGFVSVLILLYDRKPLMQASYNARVIATALALLLVGVFVDMPYAIKFLYLVLPSFIILRTVVHSKLHSRNNEAIGVGV